MNRNNLKTIFIILFLISNFVYLPNENVSAYGMDTSLANVDASFIGEKIGWFNNGSSVSIAGDVNGDGYDDILITKCYITGPGPGGGTNCYTGKVYLIFGKKINWTMDFNLSNADASFYCENNIHHVEMKAAIAGDVNNDGCDDILIGAGGNYEEGYGSGKTFLIFGKTNGWVKNLNLSNSDVVFIGEPWKDYLGISVAGVGDVNGDGYDDILIGGNKDNYLILGKKTDWVKYFNLSNANASFIGGVHKVGQAGDVNGDGFDDILMGAPNNSDGNEYGGKTYLFFGKSDGWLMNISLANANASFIGVIQYEFSGESIAGGGDVNNDGYCDFLIGAPHIGKTYLILGKSSGWTDNISLANANASFVPEIPGWAGWAISNSGDINGDGYDDIIIGAPYTNVNGTWKGEGETYIIFGKSSGWTVNVSLENSNLSFIGEADGDRSGYSVSNSGDINSDGYDDVLIGAPGDYYPEDNRYGETFLIFYYINNKPISIDTIELFTNTDYSIKVDEGVINQTIFVELTGIDGNESSINIAEVKVNSSITDINGIELRLRETGINTGIYRGNFKIANISHQSHRWIGATPGEIIQVTSIQDPIKFDTMIVKPEGFKLIPIVDNTTAIEDQVYFQKYYSVGAPEDYINWLFESNSSWLNWGTENHTLYGIPTNDDVGPYWVRINISYNNKLFDEHNFTLTVINVNNPPEIIGAPTELGIKALQEYELDLHNYIFDVDNSSSDLKLIEDSAYAIIQNLSIIFNYSNSVSFEQVRITATDGIDYSKDHIINVTVIPKDTVLPTIIEKSPTGDSVSISSNISILFSKPMNFTSIENAFSISPNIVGHYLWSFNKTQVYCECNSNLKYNQTYTINISSSARDLSGNPLDGNNNGVFEGSPLDDYSWTFTTASSMNLEPIIKIDSPLNNSVFNVNDTIYFDCANTTDFEGDILEFLWVSNISGILSTQPQFTMNLPIGHHQIILFVDDGHGHNISAFVNIIVIPFNRPPVAIIDTPKDNSIFNVTDIIHFDASNSTDADSDILDFYWYSNISGGFGYTSKLRTTLPAGRHLITLYVNDGFFHNVSIAINITVLNKSADPITNGDGNGEPTGTGEDTNLISRIGLFGIIIIIITLIILTGFVTATEVGKYGLLSFATPLYQRLKGKKVLDNEIRGMIKGYILANPGEHYNIIKRTLGLKNGTFTYHLKVLEQESAIKSKRDGIFKRFYPIEMQVPENIMHITKIQETILNEIISTPGITQKELGKKINKRHQIINYHIKKLISAGLIRAERFGNVSKYFPEE